MNEILLHFPQALSANQAARLTADLEAAHEQGRELGSRMPHIQAGAERLLQLSGILQEAIDSLDQFRGVLRLQDLAVVTELQGLVDGVRMLADTAQRYSRDNWPTQRTDVDHLGSIRE